MHPDHGFTVHGWPCCTQLDKRVSLTHRQKAARCGGPVMCLKCRGDANVLHFGARKSNAIWCNWCKRDLDDIQRFGGHQPECPVATNPIGLYEHLGWPDLDVGPDPGLPPYVLGPPGRPPAKYLGPADVPTHTHQVCPMCAHTVHPHMPNGGHAPDCVVPVSPRIKTLPGDMVRVEVRNAAGQIITTEVSRDNAQRAWPHLFSTDTNLIDVLYNQPEPESGTVTFNPEGMADSDLEQIENEWLQPCGPCDYGMPEYGCSCPPEGSDPRNVILKLVEEVRRLRGERRSAVHKLVHRLGITNTEEPAS